MNLSMLKVWPWWSDASTSHIGNKDIYCGHLFWRDFRQVLLQASDNDCLFFKQNTKHIASMRSRQCLAIYLVVCSFEVQWLFIFVLNYMVNTQVLNEVILSFPFLEGVIAYSRKVGHWIHFFSYVPFLHHMVIFTHRGPGRELPSIKVTSDYWTSDWLPFKWVTEKLAWILKKLKKW